MIETFSAPMIPFEASNPQKFDMTQFFANKIWAYVWVFAVLSSNFSKLIFALKNQKSWALGAHIFS